MSSSVGSPLQRASRRPPRRRFPVRTAVGVVFVAAVFAVGVAVGEALHDNPKPGPTLTYLRTLPPLGQTSSG